MVSRNFYWLSTKPETLDWDKSTWYYTPTKTFADYSGLNTLPLVDLQVTSKTSQEAAAVTISNPSKTLAFAVHLKVKKPSDGEEILPILWEDNYFPLLPGETRRIAATYRSRETPLVEVDGWNVKTRTFPN